MQIRYEPAGINDSCCRLSRQGAFLIMNCDEHWKSLVSLTNSASRQAGIDLAIVFHSGEIGWNGTRFTRSGTAEPIAVNAEMANLLVQRGLASRAEVTPLVQGRAQAAAPAAETDEALLLRAVLNGVALHPLYEDAPLKRAFGEPPRLMGFLLKTPDGKVSLSLGERGGAPTLDDAARAALRSRFGSPRP